MKSPLDKSNSAEYWLWQIGGWGVLSISQFFVAWRIASVSPLKAALNYGVLMILYIVSTHLLRSLGKKQHWILLSARALLIRLFVSGLILAAAIAAAHLGIAILLLKFDIDIRRQLYLSERDSPGIIFFNA